MDPAPLTTSEAAQHLRLSVVGQPLPTPQQDPRQRPHGGVVTLHPLLSDPLPAHKGLGDPQRPPDDVVGVAPVNRVGSRAGGARVEGVEGEGVEVGCEMETDGGDGKRGEAGGRV